MAQPYQASVLIAQLSLSGLPHLADNYAEIIFKEGTYPLIGYEQLVYQNIKERDIANAADVLVNGMNSDLLVLETAVSISRKFWAGTFLMISPYNFRYHC